MRADPDQVLQRALQHHAAGKLAEAEALYRQVLAAAPNHAGVMHNLGVLAGQQNRADVAEDFMRRSVDAEPGNHRFRNNLGTLFLKTKRVDLAIVEFKRSIELAPSVAQSHRNLGAALTEKGDYERATQSHRKAIALAPDLADAYVGLAAALQKMGRYDEAHEAYRQAGQLRPRWAQLELNLATLFRDRGDVEQAQRHAEAAIAIDADLPEAHLMRATCLLLRGDLASAWGDYEWRWRCAGYPPPRTEFKSPRWTGGDVSGKTVLLHSEQGFGDEIQFVRFARVVAERGAKVIVECSTPLRDLFNSIGAGIQIVARGDPIPPHDLHCPLLSTPLALGVTLQMLPGKVPYLSSDPQRVSAWKSRLSTDKRFKIGLNWAGSASHADDALRSIKLAALAPLLDVPGARFYSVQKGAPADEVAGLPPKLRVAALGPELRNFADTAAVMESLDLVITVDTSVAHLAGATGRPVWTLLARQSSEWRWMLDRSESPWYPTMRLFRQDAPRDWEGVIANVRDQLRERIDGNGGR